MWDLKVTSGDETWGAKPLLGPFSKCPTHVDNGNSDKGKLGLTATIEKEEKKERFLGVSFVKINNKKMGLLALMSPCG